MEKRTDLAGKRGSQDEIQLASERIVQTNPHEEEIVTRIGVWFVLACLTLASLSAFAKSKARSRQIYFRYLGKQRSAAIMIPEQPGPLPVLLLLHGSGRSGEVMIAEWKDLAAHEGIVLVAPDAADPLSWNLRPDSPEFLHLAVEQAAALHPIDRSRIYMFGHSAGAEYVLILSLLDSEYFAAAALHAGKLLPAFNTAFGEAKRRMPIAIWSGTRDSNFPPDEVLATKRLFDDHGYEVQLTLMPGHDHNYYAVSPEVNRLAWEFLKAERLPGNTPTPR